MPSRFNISMEPLVLGYRLSGILVLFHAQPEKLVEITAEFVIKTTRVHAITGYFASYCRSPDKPPVSLGKLVCGGVATSPGNP